MSGEMMLSFREQAMSLLDYEPETGLFRWKVRRNSRGGSTFPGKIAGTRSPYGYVQINVAQRIWLAHRLAFLFMLGRVPEKGLEVDHINGDRTDNRWANLREVTRQQNNYNLGVSRRNVSGTKGVSWNASSGKWLARIKVGGRVVHLGLYSTVEAASAARRAGEQKYHGEFARSAA
jgi:HNH endonuclease/AP2 domain